MGIRHHGRNAVRQGDTGKFCRIRHGTLNMHMDINQPRNHIHPAAVNYCCVRIANRRGNPVNLFPCNRNIPFLKALPVCQEDPGVLYHEINLHSHSPGILIHFLINY